ncbi:hypothetical protein M407DRAFT_183030 [Tulasnella calospora MUT 4182]|uniref:CFEM domain-containing protein n=1 Tax=Tulasnella calospora MUT 4182 TaxID=1051891 RepID=A0A0C3PQB7_9AGAM|nr:hypothetical protein M407DRAFT_183030 [Tulasnella calospora MUT 4182]
MRFSTVIVAIAASVVSASFLVERQSGSFPACGIPCLTNADVGTCAPTNNTCLCKSEVYLRVTTTCIKSSCSAADYATAADLGQQLCKAAGVDASTNPAAQPSGTTTTPTSNAATGSVVGKGMVVGGFVAAAAVLAL